MMELKCVSSSQQFVQKPPCVLAIDDHEDNLAIARHVLETMGCLTITANNAKEALSLANEYQPELILMDIILPEVNGLELIQQIRQSLFLCQTTIVAVTGLAFQEEKSQIFEAGFNDYLSKPYLLGDLHALVCRHLKLLSAVAV